MKNLLSEKIEILKQAESETNISDLYIITKMLNNPNNDPLEVLPYIEKIEQDICKNLSQTKYTNFYKELGEISQRINDYRKG